MNIRVTLSIGGRKISFLLKGVPDLSYLDHYLLNFEVVEFDIIGD